MEDAKKVRQGQTLYSSTHTNSDGTPQRFKVLSVKTWKTRPTHVCIGVKRGLYEYGKIVSRELQEYSFARRFDSALIDDFELSEDIAAAKIADSKQLAKVADLRYRLHKAKQLEEARNIANLTASFERALRHG